MLIGSRYFFTGYDDFTPHDTDELLIVDTEDFKQTRQLRTTEGCLFLMKKHPSKEAYIDWAIQSASGMVIGKFLIPEFCEAIGFTVEDLPKVKILLTRLDSRHKYEEIIYDSYLENGAFKLTQAQRDKAYESYKQSRIEAGY